MKNSDNIGSGELYEIHTAEGKALGSIYEVIFKFESKHSLQNREDGASYNWYFSSNLKQSNQEEPFLFKGGIDSVRMQYRDYRPEEKEILDLIKESITNLEEAQTAFDIGDIDGAGT